MLGFGPMLMEARNHRYVCFALGTVSCLRWQPPSASIGFLIMCLTTPTSQNNYYLKLTTRIKDVILFPLNYLDIHFHLVSYIQKHYP